MAVNSQAANSQLPTSGSLGTGNWGVGSCARVLKGQYTGTCTDDTRFMPVPSVILTDTPSMPPLMSHVNGCVKENCRTSKLATVTLPNWRVSDEESKMVGGTVRPNGFVGWIRTSESTSGLVPAVMLRMKGKEKGDTEGQSSWTGPGAVGTIVTMSNSFLNADGDVMTASSASSHAAERAQHTTTTAIADGMAVLICNPQSHM
jgi:hypothetical protein